MLLEFSNLFAPKSCNTLHKRIRVINFVYFGLFLDKAGVCEYNQKSASAAGRFRIFYRH